MLMYIRKSAQRSVMKTVMQNMMINSFILFITLSEKIPVLLRFIAFRSGAGEW
jgi:hypothetical protein